MAGADPASAPKGLEKVLAALPGFAHICAAAKDWPSPVYLVGGALRDALLLGRPSLDVDLAVPGRAREFAMDLRRRLGGGSSCFALHEETGVYRIAVKARAGVSPAFQVDVARLQGKDILADLARRDFTLNAMAFPLPPGSGTLLDPFKGLRDLRLKTLRQVSPKAFREDPLRALRVFRLSSKLGLKPAAKTLACARASRGPLRRCSAERLNSELMALLSAQAAPWLGSMDAAGLLTAVLPELEPLRSCARVYYGPGGVLKHSLETVARLDHLLEELDSVYPGDAGRIRLELESCSGGRVRREALLRLVALIHDVSKPRCARPIGGRLRFFGHEEKGAETAAAILRRLRFSREETDLAALLVRHHLRPGNLAAGGAVTDKAVFRFFRDLRGHGVELLLLCWADHASYLSREALARTLPFIREDPRTFDPRRPRSAAPSGKKGPRASAAPLGDADTLKTLHYLQVISLLLRRYFERPDVSRPERLLDGNEVMRLARLKPGPKVGEALRLLEEAQAEGRVRCRGEAVKLVRSWAAG